MIPYALAAVAFLVFSPALLNGFVDWDDHINLLENPSYRGLGWTHIRWMFSTTLMGHYIPVTWLSFGLDYTLWGMNPFGYHLTNNLIHAANTAVFYLIALRLLGKASSLTGGTLRAAGVMAALFFALHPLRAESVAWVTERRDVLSGLFFLLTILLYLAAADADGARRRRLLVGSVTAYALALLSKSIVMTLPLILLLLDVYPLGRLPLRRGMWRETATRALLREKLPYLALGFAGAVVSYWSVASQHFLTGVGQVRLARPDRDRGVQRLVLPREDRRAAGAVAALRAPAHREPARRALPVEHRRGGRHQPGPPGAPPPLAGGARRVDLLRHRRSAP